MAPEIIKGNGYTYMSDLWSLGVLLYECVCGPCPFGPDLSDPYEIYQEIMNNELKFPQ